MRIFVALYQGEIETAKEYFELAAPSPLEVRSREWSETWFWGFVNDLEPEVFKPCHLLKNVVNRKMWSFQQTEHQPIKHIRNILKLCLKANFQTVVRQLILNAIL